MKRREAREALLALLYEMSFNEPTELEATIEREKENRDLDDAYLMEAIHGIYAHQAELDEKISEKARRWKTDRLTRISHSILLISLYEMLYLSIPYTISINEAVELAKKYDGDDAPGFINGILNAVADDCGFKQKK